MAVRYSKEWRENVSKAVKASWINKELSKDTRLKLSKAAIKGNTGRAYKLIPLEELTTETQVRHRIFKQRGRKCQKCGWAELNPSGVIPVQVHHKDGDVTNNSEINLEVLCPNCHSLTPHFMNYNGRGKNRTPNLRTQKRYASIRNMKSFKEQIVKNKSPWQQPQHNPNN